MCSAWSPNECLCVRNVKYKVHQCSTREWTAELISTGIFCGIQNEKGKKICMYLYNMIVFIVEIDGNLRFFCCCYFLPCLIKDLARNTMSRKMKSETKWITGNWQMKIKNMGGKCSVKCVVHVILTPPKRKLSFIIPKYVTYAMMLNKLKSKYFHEFIHIRRDLGFFSQ